MKDFYQDGRDIKRSYQEIKKVKIRADYSWIHMKETEDGKGRHVRASKEKK